MVQLVEAQLSEGTAEAFFAAIRTLMVTLGEGSNAHPRTLKDITQVGDNVTRKAYATLFERCVRMPAAFVCVAVITHLALRVCALRGACACARARARFVLFRDSGSYPSSAPSTRCSKCNCSPTHSRAACGASSLPMTHTSALLLCAGWSVRVFPLRSPSWNRLVWHVMVESQVCGGDEATAQCYHGAQPHH